MKQLTQEIFEGAPDWVKSAAIHESGYARLWSVPKSNLTPCGREFISTSIFGEIVYSMPLGDGFDKTDWQNSAIDRGVIEVKLGYACGDCGYHHEPHQMRTTFCEGCDTLLS